MELDDEKEGPCRSGSHRLETLMPKHSFPAKMPEILPFGRGVSKIKPRKFISIKDRQSKVHLEFLGSAPRAGVSFDNFWKGLPSILAAGQLKEFVDRLRQSRDKGKPIVAMFGAHVIKTGLSRYLISLMEKGWVTALATNGAGVIHDFELAYAGETSEDVAAQLKKGIFGFTKETGEHLNRWAKEAALKGRGIGEAVGARISKSQFPNKALSLFARAYELNLAATVHVAIGTDIIYQHPNCDGGAWGKASYQDFLRLTEVVGCLDEGGVVMNWGSNVLMPEVFLKALAINKNLGRSFRNITAANFDMIYHYRPRVNVLERPTQERGSKAFNFIGHHEIMLPLLAQALMESES
ncbi:MAG: hypothetical protein HY547_10350 [Elusimicrobia bacterium]|nr:hypothetical protein [Elusimicrobiota bacterium]